MSRPKTTKKRKSSMNIDDGANLSSRTVCRDDELLEAEDDFHGFFLLEMILMMMMNVENKKLNIIGMTMIHMMRYWIDMKVTMEIISQCQNPKMHPLIKMSHVLGGEMFVDRTKLVEFRV